ncbi:retinol dehydrogenase 13-like [Crassostrea virginica]|uniref:Retinol dehydrogenase 13-like n=1 Tax=Crassostrea virginica TaxID=6565 RepID=A0A8B8E4Z8_CRAVI|nr:retinol dehydrogenase 13-like [Crassostrea virginica]
MTGLEFEDMLEFAKRNKVLIGSVVGLGVSFAVLRRYCAGGVCRSKARLDGKTVIITGANTGIGKETAIDLASRGARVILACRNVMRAERAATDIMKKSNTQNVAVKIVDLASLESIRKFADDINKTEPRVDILINNAGIMMCPHWKTQDGFEMQFGVNHLGHFLLTNLLLDKIKSSAPARIINVSSLAHTRTSKMNFDDLNSEKNYHFMDAYRQSKLANVLFTRELSRRLEGTNVTANSLHPGLVKTELSRYLPQTVPVYLRILLKPFAYLLSKTSVQGAQTSIYCAVEESLANVTGKYFSDCAIKEESKAAQDDEAAKKLWEVSEKMVGLQK